MTTTPRVLSASTMVGDKVRNPDGEDLGTIEDFMVDVQDGRIVYAVLSFGGLRGLGEQLFAVPWPILHLDAEHHHFILDVPVERLKRAPGFDGRDWPDFADPSLRNELETFYRTGSIA